LQAGWPEEAAFQHLNEQYSVFSPVVFMIHQSLPDSGSKPYFAKSSVTPCSCSVGNCSRQCSFFLLTPVPSCWGNSFQSNPWRRDSCLFNRKNISSKWERHCL
jgi:hypothetical protein